MGLWADYALWSAVCELYRLDEDSEGFNVHIRELVRAAWFRRRRAFELYLSAYALRDIGISSEDITVHHDGLVLQCRLWVHRADLKAPEIIAA